MVLSRTGKTALRIQMSQELAWIFEAKISLDEVTKSINYQIISTQCFNSIVINTSQLNYPLSF